MCPCNKREEKNDNRNEITEIKMSQSTISTLKISDLENGLFSFPSSLYGNSETAWPILKAKYLQQCENLGLDHHDTIVTLQRMCISAWQIFMQKRTTDAWEVYLHIIYQRFKNENINHDLKLVLLDSIAVYMHTYTKASGEALPLYDALYSNLTQILGPTHEITLRTLHHKGIHYYYMGKYIESWNLLELVYNKLKQLNLNIDLIIPSMHQVASKFLEIDNLQPFKSCLQILENYALGSNLKLIIQNLNGLAAIASNQITLQAGLKVYDDIIGFVCQEIGDIHKNTLLCKVAKAEFLLTVDREEEAWNLIQKILTLKNKNIIEKPNERGEIEKTLAELHYSLQNEQT